MYRIEVTRKTKKSKWFWRLVADNGRTVSHSETYSSQSAAIDTVKRVCLWAKKPRGIYPNGPIHIIDAA